MNSAILISSGEPVDVEAEHSVAMIRREFPEASFSLAVLMMHHQHLIKIAQRTRGTVQSDYGSKLPLSSDIDVWFTRVHAPTNPLHTILRARCPEVDTLLFISNRLGSLVKAYAPIEHDGSRHFAIPNEDLRSPNSTVMAVVPIPNW